MQGSSAIILQLSRSLEQMSGLFLFLAVMPSYLPASLFCILIYITIVIIIIIRPWSYNGELLAVGNVHYVVVFAIKSSNETAKQCLPTALLIRGVVFLMSYFNVPILSLFVPLSE